MSLHGKYDPDNIFAKIIRAEMPCVKVWEDDIALAFMDLFPQGKGHTLIVPKQVEARNFLDLPREYVGPYLERVQRTAQAVAAAFEPDGVLVTQFNGAPAGQTIYHLHFHIIPRWEGVELRRHAGQMADKGELEALAKAIAAKM